MIWLCAHIIFNGNSERKLEMIFTFLPGKLNFHLSRKISIAQIGYQLFKSSLRAYQFYSIPFFFKLSMRWQTVAVPLEVLWITDETITRSNIFPSKLEPGVFVAVVIFLLTTHAFRKTLPSFICNLQSYTNNPWKLN